MIDQYMYLEFAIQQLTPIIYISVNYYIFLLSVRCINGSTCSFIGGLPIKITKYERTSMRLYLMYIPLY